MEGEGNLLGVVAVAGREEGYIWIRRKEEGEMMKGDQPHKWRHRNEDKKILPHLPLMLASFAPLGVLGLLPGPCDPRKESIPRRRVAEIAYRWARECNKEAEENGGYVGRKWPYIYKSARCRKLENTPWSH